MTHQVSREEVVEMLRRMVEGFGLDLGRFRELGRSGELDEPALRDAWIIWGETITDEDVETPTAA